MAGLGFIRDPIFVGLDPLSLGDLFVYQRGAQKPPFSIPLATTHRQTATATARLGGLASIDKSSFAKYRVRLAPVRPPCARILPGLFRKPAVDIPAGF